MLRKKTDSFRSSTDINAADKKNRKNRKKKKKFKITPFKVIMIALAGYILFSLGQVYWEVIQLNQEVAEYKQEKEELLQEKEELEETIEKIESEEFIERQARERLGLIRPGETIIMPAVSGEVSSVEEPEDDEILY